MGVGVGVGVGVGGGVPTPLSAAEQLEVLKERQRMHLEAGISATRCVRSLFATNKSRGIIL